MKIYVGKSKTHGKGLLAYRDINKGETLFTIRGKKINFLIDNEKRAKIAGYNWIGWGKNTWVDPIKYGLYFNHSCGPNAAIEGRVKVVAINNIKKSTEITFDYSLNEADIFWHIKCDCGSKNCRKTIRSIQFLPPKVFNTYKKYTPKYFKQVFQKFHISKFKDFERLKVAWVGFIKRGFSV
ncbi:hypothetical protein A3A01_00075 [Candidatus Nomurabacteria bacterium RIFCSPLOWO2_01_FULL_39_17]|uniref:SET domain-containing protein n=1 Tax=Candidatus Nomurabacteria bacterium RIFCSPLOWO2_01_FULL_39_17 TaxID=1801770 RepID=A0A1F6WUY7_9BACT|nr:MAG: hypothetical protein A3A01_00075 [Candidatus Nomurabacteria bacterium RIFCSPLOWO2_01_FULL_39_17]